MTENYIGRSYDGTWTPPTAEEQAEADAREAAAADRWGRLPRHEQIRRQLEHEARHLYPEQFLEPEPEPETGNYVDPEPDWDAGSPYVDHAHGVVFYDKASEVDAGRARWPEYRHVGPGPGREPEPGLWHGSP